MVKFTASRAQPCRADLPGHPPHETVPGTECGYVENGAVVCADCRTEILAAGQCYCGPNGGPHVHTDAPTAAEQDVADVPALCGCTDTRDGFSTDQSPIPGVAVHVRCGLPRALPPGHEFPEEGARLSAVLDAVGEPHTDDGSADPTTFRRECRTTGILAGLASGTVGAPVHTAAVPTMPEDATGQTVLDVARATVDSIVSTPPVGEPVPGATVIVCEPPKRRGRPPKPHPAPGLDVEKRPGGDRWCVVHVESATPLVLGISAKAKAVEVMTRCGQVRGVDWTQPLFGGGPISEFLRNEQLRILGASTYREDLFREFTAEPGVPDRAAAPGDTPGPVARPVPDAASREGEGGTGSEGNDGRDQSGTPGGIPGVGPGDGDAPGPDEAAQTGTSGEDAGGPGVAGTGLPGSGGTGDRRNGVVGIAGGLSAAPTAGHADPGTDAGTDPASPRTEGAAIGLVTWVASVGTDEEGEEPVSAPTAPAVNGPTLTGGFGSITLPEPTPGPARPVGEPGHAPGGMTLIDGTRPSLAAFSASARSTSLAGNTPFAAAYAGELREIVHRRASQAPRSLQRHLGPSEIGHRCDRQIVGKLIAAPSTNHVVDPWPSILGTAQHAWFAEAFAAENAELGRVRWVPEQRVDPFGTAGTEADHSGTADLYDVDNEAVDDHKVLGETTMAQVRSPEGPPIHYVRQLKLYALGYRRMGLPVKRVCLIAWPRTAANLDGLYVWEHVLTPEDDEDLRHVFERMAWRRKVAAAVERREIGLMDVPAVPDAHDCYFCPLFRPQSAKDGGPGCPGHIRADGEGL